MLINQLIDKQIEAYNNREMDSMWVVCSDDIKFLNFSDNKVLINGIEECKKMYTDFLIIPPAFMQR